MKTAIVTGASGFIGKILVNYLVSKSVYVYAVVRSEKSDTQGISASANIIVADFDSYAQLNNLILKNVDVFYHLAWDGTSGIDRKDYLKQLGNMRGTVEAYKIAGDLKCGKFISTGTISERLVEKTEIENCNENLIYAMMKRKTYQLLSTYSNQNKTPLVWAQLSNLYGKNNNTGNIISYTLKSLMNHEIPEYSKAIQPYDLMDVNDAVYALYLLGVTRKLRHNFYFVGSGEPRILKEYLLEISSLFGDDQSIKLGAKPDDGYVYNWEWFDIRNLVEDTGFKVSDHFSNHIRMLVKELGCHRDQ